MSKSEKYNTQQEFESTVFTDPLKHNDKVRSPHRRRLTAVFSAVLAVALVSAGVFAAIKLIPEKEEPESSLYGSISVIEANASSFTSVILKNGEEITNLYPVEDESEEGGTSKLWYLEGIDQSKISTSLTASFVSSSASITAMREITEKSAADCGLENPGVQIDVTSDDGIGYSVLLGLDSPDGLGTYLKLSVSDKIYVVSSDTASALYKSAIDFADTTSFTPAQFTTDVSAYKNEGGALETFDSLTISGKAFGDRVVVTPNPDTQLSENVPYVMVSPESRYAQNVDTVMRLFTDSLSVEGGYSYYINDQTLAQFGLDDPDYYLELKVGSEIKTFKINRIDDTYSAVAADDSTFIKKVTTNYIACIDITKNDMYSGILCGYNLDSVKSFTLTEGSDAYSFDITTDQNGNYTVTSSGKEVNAESFESFYSTLADVTALDFTTSESGSVCAQITVTLNNGGIFNLSLLRGDGTKYSYAINGTVMGRISTSSYNKILNAVKEVK